MNILVTADHGFSTTTGGFRLAEILGELGLADQVRMVRNMIYPRNEDLKLAGKVVEALQRDAYIGNIYTRPVRAGDEQGAVPGTLSTSAKTLRDGASTRAAQP